uniref:NADH-ubiquinone oxidoreductase chain 4 n=1 Tax=Lepidotrigona terminata TaxID=398115 RepID=A0A6B9MNU9_9HYME|nr:NADH dehydrogenase subunit 4 [Lepidotrigona terminata]
MNRKMNEIMLMTSMLFMTLFFNNTVISNNMSIMVIFYLLKFNWLNWSNIYWNFGINFYSNGLIIMMIWIFMIILMNGNMTDYKNYCMFMNVFLMLSMYIVFLSMNLILFYFMFESSLLIIFYMVMKWGYGEFRFNSSFYLMFYTLVFSLPMLYLIFSMLVIFNTMNFYIMEMIVTKMNKFKFIYFIMSFMVKIPMYMVHGWLLKAHVEASFFSSMVLASVMLKLGSYGVIRMLYIMKDMFNECYCYFISISVFGMLMMSFMCMSQIDFKIIIAISSIVHMSIMTMGMLLMNKTGIYGSYYMMISHGFISSGLFYLTNLIYLKTNSRMMYVNKGMVNSIPSLMMFLSLMCFCNVGSPFSLNLISEIIIMLSLINWMKYIMIVIMIYCMLSFIYSIYLFSFIYNGKLFMAFKMSEPKMMNYLSLMLHLIPVNTMFLNLM